MSEVLTKDSIGDAKDWNIDLFFLCQRDAARHKVELKYTSRKEILYYLFTTVLLIQSRTTALTIWLNENRNRLK